MAQECRNLAADVAAGTLSQDELSAVMDRLEAAKATLGPLDNIESGMLKKGRAILSDIEAAAQIEKRNRLKNIIAENRLWAQIERADEATGDPSLGLKAALVGVNAPFDGSSRSVDALANGIMGEWTGGLIQDLKKAGVHPQFNKMKGDLQRNVARALYDLNMPEPQGADVPADAMTIAKIMKKYQDAAKSRQNQAGAYIQDRAGYVTRQTHNAGKMARKGFNAWAAEVRGRLDFDKMEVPQNKREEFLFSAYQAIKTGIRLTDEVSPVESAFKGPGNLGKKVSASRTLIFKGADEWFDYNAEFGTGDLRETFMAGLSSAASSSALMDQLGTNPVAMVDRIKAQAEKKYRDTSGTKEDKLKGFHSQLETIDNMLAEVTGDVNIGATSTVARVSSAFRAVQTMAKLGGAAISAMSDIAFVAANRSFQGRTFVGSMQDAFMSPFEGLSGGDKRQMADLMGVGLEGQLGDFMSRFNAQDDVAGMTSKAMASFFKLNLLGPWSDANKRGVTFMISRDLASNAGSAFADLPGDMQRMLRTYGIDAKGWDVARQSVKKASDGREYLMPGDVGSARGSVFNGMSQPQQDRLRRDVRESLFTLLSSEADFAVPSPGARERGIMRRGYRPGTVAGEAVRFVGQFKSFGVTALTKVMGRQVYGKGAKTFREQLGRGMGANIGLIHATLSVTVLGYFVMQAKEILKGREPREASAETFIAAAMQGGGLGIYGDFLFGEASRFGGGTLDTISGPGIGTATEALDLLQRTRGVVEGGEEDLRGDYMRFAKSNTPFANLFYVKPVFDYLLWYNMQEMINPGYLRRMERRIERENNQQYWLPPSKVIQAGGGFK